MSLLPNPLYRVPDETARVARAAFPNGTLCVRIYDELGTIYADEDFAALFPSQGQHALAPVRLALVTLLQFLDGLSDRAAADAVRSRIDWKYLLFLELSDLLLTRLRDRGLVKARGRQRTDSTHVLAAVRGINRLECVVETMRDALNALATAAPDWLARQARAEWVERYGPRTDDFRLPVTKAERDAYAEVVGADGWDLLSAVVSPEAPAWLREIPLVETLRRVWVQQFAFSEGRVRWRASEETPPAGRMISSPYDTEARYARKRTTSWIGYKVHITESCDEEGPHVVTHVETAEAASGDADVVDSIHEELERKDLLPEQHLVDTGYVEAKLLVRIPKRYGVDLYGPTRSNYRWQAQAGQGYDAAHFEVDWEKQQMRCPKGKTSQGWTPALDRGDNDVIKVKFSSKDCRPCESRALCTRSTKEQRRTVTIRARESYEALQAARERQKSAEFAEQYAKRAGAEGTISQAVRAFGMRRSRYVGIAKTRLQHLVIGAAVNLARINDWFAHVPRARTRQSAFQRLMASAVPA